MQYDLLISGSFHRELLVADGGRTLPSLRSEVHVRCQSQGERKMASSARRRAPGKPSSKRHDPFLPLLPTGSVPIRPSLFLLGQSKTSHTAQHSGRLPSLGIHPVIWV